MQCRYHKERVQKELTSYLAKYIQANRLPEHAATLLRRGTLALFVTSLADICKYLQILAAFAIIN